MQPLEQKHRQREDNEMQRMAKEHRWFLTEKQPDGRIAIRAKIPPQRVVAVVADPVAAKEWIRQHSRS